MKKKIVIVFMMSMVSLGIAGCGSSKMSDYQLWRASDEAMDLNGDRKINEADYQLFINPPPSAYETWRNSDDAEDLNGDRKINEADYELFINPPPSAYELWLESADAADLNNDSLINATDYNLFVDFHQFIGVYQVENFVYEGEESIVFDSYRILLEDVHRYLPQVVFTVHIDKRVTVTIPSEVQTKVEDNYAIFQQVIQHLVLTKISDNLLALDIEFQYLSREFNLSLYFERTENGLSLNYTAMDVIDNSLLFVINLDLIKQ